MLILVAICVLVGVLAGLMGGALGLGGGVVIVPALIAAFHLMDYPASVLVHLAVATSLASIVVTSISAVLAHHRRGNLRGDLIRPLVPGVALGAFAGAFLASALPGDWLARLFGIFAMAVSARMFLAGGGAEADRERRPGAPVLAAAGTAMGVLSSLFGIGGGSMTVPFLQWCRVTIRQAVAVSSACGLPIALAGTLGFVIAGWGHPDLPAGALGYVHLPAALAIMATSWPAARAGAGLAHRLPAVLLRRLFALLLFLVGLRLLLL